MSEKTNACLDAMQSRDGNSLKMISSPFVLKLFAWVKNCDELMMMLNPANTTSVTPEILIEIPFIAF